MPKEDNGASGHTVVGILFNYMNKLRDQIIYGSWPATVLSAEGKRKDRFPSAGEDIEASRQNHVENEMVALCWEERT